MMVARAWKNAIDRVSYASVRAGCRSVDVGQRQVQLLPALAGRGGLERDRLRGQHGAARAASAAGPSHPLVDELDDDGGIAGTRQLREDVALQRCRGIERKALRSKRTRVMLATKLATTKLASSHKLSRLTIASTPRLRREQEHAEPSQPIRWLWLPFSAVALTLKLHPDSTAVVVVAIVCQVM